MTAFTQSSLQIVNALLPLLIVAGMALAGLLVERVVLHRLARLAARTAWQGDDVIVAALRGKLVIWSALLGAVVALPVTDWPVVRDHQAAILKMVLALFVASLTFLVARVSAGLIGTATRPDTRPALSIVTNIVRVAIFVIGFILALQIFSVTITPALAALGVGGLAVSLALQATLTDLVSGLQIIAARQIQHGHYIKLSTGEEGYVTDINWRTTSIRQLSNNLVIIPNAKMTSTIVTNYHAPEKMLSVPVELGVSYDADLERVERVTLEVAGEVMRDVPGGVPESEPTLRFLAFGDSSVQLRVSLKGQEFADQFVIRHEFLKRLHRRYIEEGIEIPFPTRTVRFEREGTLAALAPTTVARHAMNGHAGE